MEKRYNVFFADEVFEDLADIPSKIGDAILDNIEILERFPRIGLEIDRKSWKGFQLVTHGYRVLYKIDEKKKLVKIYHIRHGKMDFQ
jgi:mRNA-degrading endonuclease RelE of RelBE toxin-antitoxin system